MSRVSLLKIPKKNKSKRVRLLVYISGEAKENLEELRLRSLDRKGRKPDRSEIVDKLLTAALYKGKVPYPSP